MERSAVNSRTFSVSRLIQKSYKNCVEGRNRSIGARALHERMREFAGRLDYVLILVALLNPEREGKPCDQITYLIALAGHARPSFRMDDLAPPTLGLLQIA
jgi:hypothetical protein